MKSINKLPYIRESMVAIIYSIYIIVYLLLINFIFDFYLGIMESRFNLGDGRVLTYGPLTDEEIIFSIIRIIIIIVLVGLIRKLLNKLEYKVLFPSLIRRLIVGFIPLVSIYLFILLLGILF